MKVVAITASRRKGNTYHIISQIKNMLEKNNIELQIINLYDYKIDFCIGCEGCILKGNCVLQDDVAFIVEQLKGADGIILSSPVYLESVSGKLKTFVDRTCTWFHRPELYGKPLLVVSTTKGSGLKYTLKYLERIGTQWGTYNCGSIGRDIRSIKKEVTERECEKFVQSLKSKKSTYKPSVESIINFSVQKVLSRNINGLDEAYWMENGWYSQPYYFTCKINVVKKALGNITYGFLNKVMNSKNNK